MTVILRYKDLTMKTEKKDLSQIIFMEIIVPILIGIGVYFLFVLYEYNTPHRRFYLLLLCGIMVFSVCLILNGIYNIIKTIIHNKKIKNA